MKSNYNKLLCVCPSSRLGKSIEETAASLAKSPTKPHTTNTNPDRHITPNPEAKQLG